MAITRIGALASFTSSSAAASLGNITVPSDATLAVVCVAGGGGTAPYFSIGSVTIGGVALTAVIGGADGEHLTIFYLISPGTGTQNLSFNWGATPAIATDFVYGFYKGIDTASAIRDIYGSKEATSHLTDTMTAESGDMVLAWCVEFSEGAEVLTWTNATEIGLFGPGNPLIASWAEATPGGTVQIEAVPTFPSGGGIIAIVFKLAPALALVETGVARSAGVYSPRGTTQPVAGGWA
jgi:hypothetical protein